MLTLTIERKKHGWSMSKLAQKADMHVSSISQIEGKRLNPYPGQMEKIAIAIGWTDDLAKLFEEIEA